MKSPAKLILIAVIVLMAASGKQLFGAESPAASTAVTNSSLDSQFGVGSWIWGVETHDGQECHFWRTVTIPANANVSNALLRITADNVFTLFVDGQEIGTGADWRTLIEYDLTQLMTPGIHVLAIRGDNSFDVAGLLMGMRIEMANGQMVEIGSDANWKVVPINERNWLRRTKPRPEWPPATVKGAFGHGPWYENFIRTVYHAPVSKPLIIRFWQTGWFQIALASVCGLVTLVCLFLVSRLVLQSQAQLVVQRERSRIARDIHDDLTSGLTQLVLLGETMRSDLPESSEMRPPLNQLCNRLRSLLQSMNETVWVINSQRDTLKDFVSYVCKFAESFLQQTPLRCRFEVEQDLPPLPCDVGIRRNLFFAVKEAINNVLKHSGATEVFLRIHLADGQVVVCVEDNGRGFDIASADPGRNGLTNMRQRAAEAGGVCRISSSHKAGCRVEFQVPLNRPKRTHFRWLVQRWRGESRPALPSTHDAPRSGGIKNP